MTEPQAKLNIVPCEFGEACLFVKQHHRHHIPPVGHKFSLAVCDGAGVIRGVAIVGRPVSRHLDDGLTLEVTRVATDGAANACPVRRGTSGGLRPRIQTHRDVYPQHRTRHVTGRRRVEVLG